MRGLKRYRSKGRWYCYAGPSRRVRINSPAGTPEFAAEIEGARAFNKVDAFGGDATTVAQAYEQFRLGGQYQQLPLRTRAGYQLVAEWLATTITMPLDVVNVALVRQLRDKAHRDRGYRFANFVLAFFLDVIAYAVEAGQLRHDPIAGRITKIPRPKSTAPASRSWTIAQRDVANRGPRKSRVRSRR